MIQGEENSYQPQKPVSAEIEGSSYRNARKHRLRLMSVAFTTIGSAILIWSAASAYFGIGFVLRDPSTMAGMGTGILFVGVILWFKKGTG